MPHRRPLLLLLLALALAAGCTAPPGFIADASPAQQGTPSLTVVGDVDEAGSHATLHVVARDIGSVLGLSAHVVVDGAHLAIDSATAPPYLGDDGRTLALVNGADVAVGGSHTTATSSAVADGDIAVLTVHAAKAGASTVTLVDALARDADGTFLPVAVAGGSLVLEVAR